MCVCVCVCSWEVSFSGSLVFAETGNTWKEVEKTCIIIRCLLEDLQSDVENEPMNMPLSAGL